MIGQTASGKTTLAKKLCKQAASDGISSIVLDPIGDPDWTQHGAGFVTSDPEKFSEVVKASRSCWLFVDESGEAIGRYNDSLFWLATRSRHYGHRAYFLTQRGAQLSPTVRDQCTELFLFSCSTRDAKILSEEFIRPELLQAPEFPPGKCFRVRRYRPTETLTIF
jgi:hypothetical protein